MIGPDLAIQAALRTRLTNDAGVTALVPASSILDTNKAAPRPSIVLGEGLAREGEGYARKRWEVTHTVHVWTLEPSTQTAKRIAAAIAAAVRAGRPELAAGYHCPDWRILWTRVLRDPDGETSHAIITVEAMVQEVEP